MIEAKECQMIEAKVAAVPDENTILLNIGALGGVLKGMKVRPVHDTVEVRDPNSSELLGFYSSEAFTAFTIMTTHLHFSVARRCGSVYDSALGSACVIANED